MKVHVVRSERMRSGSAHWSAPADIPPGVMIGMGAGLLDLCVSSRAVTRVGAASLQRAYAVFMERGEWGVTRPEGLAVTAAYQLGPLPRKVPVRIVNDHGHFTVTLSDLHFTEPGCLAIAVCVQESIDADWWRYYPAPSIAARGMIARLA